MSDRIAQNKFTLPEHGELLDEINETIINLKKRHLLDQSGSYPTWESIIELLDKCHHALKEKRFHPVKY